MLAKQIFKTLTNAQSAAHSRMRTPNSNGRLSAARKMASPLTICLAAHYYVYRLKGQRNELPHIHLRPPRQSLSPGLCLRCPPRRKPRREDRLQVPQGRCWPLVCLCPLPRHPDATRPCRRLWLRQAHGGVRRAAKKLAATDPAAFPDYGTAYNAFKAALATDDGYSFDANLRKAGFEVFQTV